MPAMSRVVAVTVVSVLAAGVLAGCRSAEQTAAGEPEVVKLGTMVALSGDSAPIGAVILRAQQAAVREANEAGGVLGRQVELVTADEACDPGAGVLAANKLVAEDITVSVGGMCSSATVPTLRIFHDAGIPMIIPGANSTELLAPGYDTVFLMTGTVKAEAQFAIHALRELGSRKMVVVHDGTSFPETLARSAVDAAGRPGSGITLRAQMKLAQGAASYMRAAREVTGSGADTVFYTGYVAEFRQFVADLRDAGYTGKIIAGDGVSDEVLQGLTARQLTDVYRIVPTAPQFMPSLAAWSARFRTATGTAPGAFSAEAYDSVNLALDAIRRAGTTDRDAVRHAIADTKDLKMLTGDPRFNPDGSRVSPTFLLLRSESGRFTLVTSTLDEATRAR